MKRLFLFAALIPFIMPIAADAAMLRKESRHPVKATLDRLEAVLKEKGLKVFARIDHAAGRRVPAWSFGPPSSSSSAIRKPERP